MRRHVVIDSETTGLSHASGDRMVTFGAIELIDGVPGRALHLIFNPGRPSHPRALAVHGMPDEILRRQPPFSAAAEEIARFLDQASIVAHNASFDLGFLDSEFRRCGFPGFQPQTTLCTMRHYRSAYTGPAKLDVAAARFGIDTDGRKAFHGALVDADVASQIFQAMILRRTPPTGIVLFEPTNAVGSVAPRRSRSRSGLSQPGKPASVSSVPAPYPQSSPLTVHAAVAGKTFAFTGTMRISRSDAIAMVEKAGGIGRDSGITRTTDYLVVGGTENKISGNIAKAIGMKEKYGKPSIIAEADFFLLVNG